MTALELKLIESLMNVIRQSTTVKNEGNNAVISDHFISAYETAIDLLFNLKLGLVENREHGNYLLNFDKLEELNQQHRFHTSPQNLPTLNLELDILNKEKFADIVKSNPIIHKCYQTFIHNEELMEKSDFSDFLIYCIENLLIINKSISESVYEMTKKYYMNIPKIPEGGDSPTTSEHSVITTDNLEKNYIRSRSRNE